MPRLGTEEVAERHFGLDVAPMGVSRNAIRRDHRQVHGIARSRLLDIAFAPRLKLQGVVVINREQTLSVLDFTEIRHTIITLYDQVDLPALVILGLRLIVPSVDSGDGS